MTLWAGFEPDIRRLVEARLDHHSEVLREVRLQPRRHGGQGPML
jgi:hypothetical protein